MFNSVSKKTHSDNTGNNKIMYSAHLHFAHILNCKGWEQRNAKGDIDLELCDQHIMHIIERFKKPLKNTGFEIAYIVEEWNDLISYAIALLNCSSTKNLGTWHLIFNSKKCKIEFKNIILVVLLLPVSTAKLERLFLMLKHLKGDTCAGCQSSRRFDENFASRTTSSVF